MMEITIPIPNLSYEMWALLIYGIGAIVVFFVTALLSKYNICTFGDRLPPVSMIILLWPFVLIFSIFLGTIQILAKLWDKLAQA